MHPAAEKQSEVGVLPPWAFTVWWQRHSWVRYWLARPALRRRARQLWALALFGLAVSALLRAGHAVDLRRAWAASLGLGAPLLLLLALPSVSLFVKMLGWR